MPPLIPTTIAPPFARYAHGFTVPVGHQLVMTSGQLGMAADGMIPDNASAQADICFTNISEILNSAGASPADVVKLTAYVTDRAHMQGYMAARDAWLADHDVLPASTLVIVSGFTRPEFLVEVEAIASILATAS
ncbi:RidA family protein [Pseudaestuariivita rosea]|uniref:RidA family protein n=1 Tax=Pseudaestuariivita rosea TaxID=2763263 RepID=UPI001ABB7BAB|nr:RidA family protein [Pseudaestuariivita rosea]